jgi:MFS family permease
MDSYHTRSAITLDKLWSIPFLLIILVNFFIYLGNFMLLSTLPLIIVQTGGNKIMAGLITGIYSFTGLLSRLQIGSILDRKGRQPFLFGGLFFLLLIVAFYNASISYSIILLFILRALHGVGWSTVTTSTGTIAADLIPSSRRSEGMGFYGISISVAMVLGPGLGLYVLEHYGYNSLFLFSNLFIAISLIISAMNFYYNRHQDTNDHQPSQQVPFKETPAYMTRGQKLKALFPAFLFFFIATSYSTIMIFLPPYASSLGIKNIGLFFIVIALAMTLTRLTTGRIADRFGRNTLIISGLILLTIALQYLSMSSSLSMLIIAAAIYGLGFGIVQPILNAMAIFFAPSSRKGWASAMFLSAQDIGGIVGSLIWGVISEVYGYTYIYSISAVLTIVTIGIYYREIINNPETREIRKCR